MIFYAYLVILKSDQKGQVHMNLKRLIFWILSALCFGACLYAQGNMLFSGYWLGMYMNVLSAIAIYWTFIDYRWHKATWPVAWTIGALIVLFRGAREGGEAAAEELAIYTVVGIFFLVGPMVLGIGWPEHAGRHKMAQTT